MAIVLLLTVQALAVADLVALVEADLADLAVADHQDSNGQQ